MARREKGSKTATAQADAAHGNEKKKAGRPRPAGKQAGGGGKASGGKAVQPAWVNRIVEFAPTPRPATLAERFALLERQRQRLGTGRRRTAVQAPGVASGGVTKKQQRRRKGKASSKTTGGDGASAKPAAAKMQGAAAAKGNNSRGTRRGCRGGKRAKAGQPMDTK